MKVLVLGGAGFIGRAVVRALASIGAEVVIGTRRPSRWRAARSRSTTSGHRVEVIELHRLLRPDDWHARIAPFDVIVNCVGILRERWRETYSAVYRDAPVALATACATRGKRFIHVTALGLSAAASSGFITAKLAGERGIEAMPGEHCIVRPSLLDGADGFGARWLRRVAQWPLHFVPADAAGDLAPLNVNDLGEAIAHLSACPREHLPRSVELGGELQCDMAQYLRLLRRRPADALLVRVPAWLTRACAHVLDALHVTPLSWGHVELMRRDNLPRPADAGALRHWLGRAPLSFWLAPHSSAPHSPIPLIVDNQSNPRTSPM